MTRCDSEKVEDIEKGDKMKCDCGYETDVPILWYAHNIKNHPERIDETMTRCDSEKVEDIRKVLDQWNTEQLGDRDTIDRIWDIMEDEP